LIAQQIDGGLLLENQVIVRLLEETLAEKPLNLKKVQIAIDCERKGSLPRTSVYYRKILDLIVGALQSKVDASGKRWLADVEINELLMAAGYDAKEVSPRAIAARSYRLRARGADILASPRARRPRSKKYTSTGA